jgi:hypothetical protein
MPLMTAARFMTRFMAHKEAKRGSGRSWTETKKQRIQAHVSTIGGRRALRVSLNPRTGASRRCGCRWPRHRPRNSHKPDAARHTKASAVTGTATSASISTSDDDSLDRPQQGVRHLAHRRAAAARSRPNCESVPPLFHSSGCRRRFSSNCASFLPWPAVIVHVVLPSSTLARSVT